MNFFWSSYSYDSSMLLALEPSEYAYIGGIVAVGILLYFILPILKKMRDTQKIQKEKKLNKQRIQDLIAMKEIQWEIDQEMREALIHSELRSKKEHQPEA